MTSKRRLLVLLVSAHILLGGGMVIYAGVLRPYHQALREAEESTCMRNLKEVWQALHRYRKENHNYPPHAGVRFFAEAFAAQGSTPKDSEFLSCPGVSTRDLPDKWWIAGEQLDGDYSGYAGRDNITYPIKGPGYEEPLVACDNAHGMNHHDVTHVLYGDGSITAISLKDEKAMGTVHIEARKLVVGPDSPMESLRKLSLE